MKFQEFIKSFSNLNWESDIPFDRKEIQSFISELYAAMIEHPIICDDPINLDSNMEDFFSASSDNFSDMLSDPTLSIYDKEELERLLNLNRWICNQFNIKHNY